MTDKPSEAAIREACRRLGRGKDADVVIRYPGYSPGARLAASLIEKYEPDTLIDPVTRRARMLLADEYSRTRHDVNSRRCLAGDFDTTHEMLAIIRALKEGMPK